jgi:hypothetical protein
MGLLASVVLTALTATAAMTAVIAVIAGSALVAGVRGTAGAATPHAEVSWTPVLPNDFPDPSILLYKGVDYGYSTQNFPTGNESYVNIQTAASTNGINWTEGSDALPTLPSWATPAAAPPPYRNTWAPSVAFNGTDFVMFYTATDTENSSPDYEDQCIGMATATAPGGPFTDSSTVPFECQGSQGGSIDPDIFTQTVSGVTSNTLIWKNDGNHNQTAVSIWAQPLEPTLTSFVSATAAPVAILTASQPWQAGIVEGPDMVDVGGADYLFYSGNAESTVSYAIGYATCFSGPLQRCTDAAANPLLTSGTGMSGPGGPSIFATPAGKVYLAFSAWNGTNTNYFSGGYRPMFMATLTFTSGVPSLAPANAPATVVTQPAVAGPGYWQVASDGGIFTFGSAQFYGSTGNIKLNKPVVGMTATPDGDGYWLVASDGGIFAFGDAGFYGSTGNIHLNKPIVGMAATADGRGYWLVASDGGIFAFGDAGFYGSEGGVYLRYPIVGMTPTVGGGGYWFVDSDGDIFSFGNAKNYGQPAASAVPYGITGMAGTSNSGGYWMVGANGSMGTYGDAVSYGSPYGEGLDGSIVGIAATSDAQGYWLQGSDGGIFSYGDAAFEGSMGGKHLNAPMVGIAAV